MSNHCNRTSRYNFADPEFRKVLLRDGFRYFLLVGNHIRLSDVEFTGAERITV